MLDEIIVYEVIEHLKRTFVNAFFTVQLSISKALLVKYADVAIVAAITLASAVIHLTIQKKGLVFMLDERFDLELIDNFKDRNIWTYEIDPEALNRGYTLCYYKKPTIKVLSPIVWSLEGHA